MMQIERATGFDKQLRNLIKKHYSKLAFKKALTALATQNEDMLHALKDHALHDNLQGLRELHIQTDWLLIYQIHQDTLILVLVATGTHDELFK